MATKKSSAGGFSQMPKMITDEPTVILKLKKGGKVAHKAKGGKAKEEHGHKHMKHMMDGGVMGALANTPALIGRPALNTPVARPAKPSMAARRAAMMATQPGAMKKGGKAHHHAEGGMESKAEERREEKRLSHLEKEMKHHEGMKAGKAHHGLKHGGKAHHKFAKGGATGEALDAFETKTTIEHDEKPYVETEMHTAKRDTAHGTGGVKEGNAGGYKHGGKAHHAHGGKVHRVSGHPEGSHAHHKAMAKHHAEQHHAKGGSAHHAKMHEHHMHLAKMAKGGHKYAVGGTVSENVAKKYENTMMHTDEYEDKVHGPTGGVKEGNAGGFKRGGKVHHKATGGVMESNAGGYKHGGHAAKKAYATGGNVNKQGSPVALVPRGVSGKKAPPVAINMLSGTYKKGGQVAPGNKRLQGIYAEENAPAVKEAKADTRLQYDQDVYQGQDFPKAPSYKKKGGMAC